MSTVPTSWLISILSVFIAVAVVSRPSLPVTARVLFGFALGLVTVVTVFVGLRSEYGFDGLSQIQPHIAILIAPTLWLGFQSLTSSTGLPTRQKLVQAVIGLVVGQLALSLPMAWSVDLVVIGTNVICAILLARMLFQSPEVFVQVAPNKFLMTRGALFFAFLFIALIIAADLIFVALLSAGNTEIIQLLTGVSGAIVTVVLLCALVGVPLVLGGQTLRHSRDSTAVAPLEEDQDLLRKLDQLMAEQKMFTDPDLTLARLGRRLHCPARSISKAVNRIHGENISRYINGFRVRHAATLLTTTDLPVTDIMLESGFQSKSSFNTEFRRVTGQTPSAYKHHRSGDKQVRNRDFKRSET